MGDTNIIFIWKGTSMFITKVISTVAVYLVFIGTTAISSFPVEERKDPNSGIITRVIIRNNHPADVTLALEDATAVLHERLHIGGGGHAIIKDVFWSENKDNTLCLKMVFLQH